MAETEYPSWRDVLEDDSKIANLHCAAKYVFWHTAYALLAVFGLALVQFAKVYQWITGTSGAKRVSNIMSSSRAKAASRYMANALLILGAVLAIVTIGLMLLEDPVLFVMAVGWIVGVFIISMLVVLFVDEGLPYLRQLLGGTGERAAQTPVVRRVYGRCPVHMDIEPQWYEELFE